MFPFRTSAAIAAALTFFTTATVVSGAPQSDPCAVFAGQQFVVPSEALACLKSFPFNETLRQNVISTISGVFDFFTFEDWYLKSPSPFQESTSNIRAEIARINTTTYKVSELGSLNRYSD